MYEALFQTLNLNEQEAGVYEILLNTGPAPAREILKKTPALKRSNLYNVLNGLKNHGLVGEKLDKAGITVFYPESPDRLEGLLTEQEKKLAQSKSQFASQLPILKNLFMFTQERPVVRFFEGERGIRTVIFDSLTAKGPIYTLMDPEALDKYAKQINEEYMKKRLELKIPKKILAIDSAFARAHYQKLASSYSEVRLIPSKWAPFATGMQIYNNVISYTTLTDKKKIGVIIEDENIAQMHRSLFEYMWETLEKQTNPLSS